MKLNNFFSQHWHKIYLTTNTWNSLQSMTYMSLMEHFIDNGWKLRKKVINFCQVLSHMGKNLAKTIEDCLSSWGLTRIISSKVDNATQNNKAIKYL